MVGGALGPKSRPFSTEAIGASCALLCAKAVVGTAAAAPASMARRDRSKAMNALPALLFGKEGEPGAPGLSIAAADAARQYQPGPAGPLLVLRVFLAFAGPPDLLTRLWPRRSSPCRRITGLAGRCALDVHPQHVDRL